MYKKNIDTRLVKIPAYNKFTGGLKRRSAHAPKGQQHPKDFNNDPSAGSPTETLLRLLLPLNDQV
jgi:hypothetical protein